MSPGRNIVIYRLLPIKAVRSSPGRQVGPRQVALLVTTGNYW